MGEDEYEDTGVRMYAVESAPDEPPLTFIVNKLTPKRLRDISYPLYRKRSEMHEPYVPPSARRGT